MYRTIMEKRSVLRQQLIADTTWLDEFNTEEFKTIKDEFYRMDHYKKQGWKPYFSDRMYEDQRALMQPFFLVRDERDAYWEDDDRFWHPELYI